MTRIRATACLVATAAGGAVDSTPHENTHGRDDPPPGDDDRRY